jgi:hypothetical protein
LISKVDHIVYNTTEEAAHASILVAVFFCDLQYWAAFGDGIGVSGFAAMSGKEEVGKEDDTRRAWKSFMVIVGGEGAVENDV